MDLGGLTCFTTGSSSGRLSHDKSTSIILRRIQCPSITIRPLLLQCLLSSPFASLIRAIPLVVGVHTTPWPSPRQRPPSLHIAPMSSVTHPPSSHTIISTSTTKQLAVLHKPSTEDPQHRRFVILGALEERVGGKGGKTCLRTKLMGLECEAGWVS